MWVKIQKRRRNLEIQFENIHNNFNTTSNNTKSITKAHGCGWPHLQLETLKLFGIILFRIPLILRLKNSITKLQKVSRTGLAMKIEQKFPVEKINANFTHEKDWCSHSPSRHMEKLLSLNICKILQTQSLPATFNLHLTISQKMWICSDFFTSSSYVFLSGFIIHWATNRIDRWFKCFFFLYRHWSKFNFLK